MTDLHGGGEDMLKRFKALTDVCNRDARFLDVARFVEGNVRLGLGEAGYILTFGGGRLLGVTTDADLAAPWRYELVGPAEEWERIWRGEFDLTAALVPGIGRICVRGDRVKYAGEVQTLVRLSRLMPFSMGVSATRVDAPVAPEHADPWLWKHEVVGRYIDVDGVRTYYETIGVPSKVTFLAFHTSGRDCRQWQQFGNIIGEAGQLIAFDFPGHGKSWPLPGGSCLTELGGLAEFAWRFWLALNVRTQVVVVGCSLGGNLALDVASRHPGEVAAMVSMEGAAHTPTTSAESLALMDHPKVNIARYFFDRTATLTGTRASLERRHYLEWEAQVYASVVQQSDQTAYTLTDLRGRLSSISCPCLLIRGGDDWAVTEEMVRSTARQLTAATSVQVVMPTGVGHFGHVEQPEELGRVALDFLYGAKVLTNGNGEPAT